MKFAIIFKKTISECFNLPIRILINVQVLKPGEFEHAPFKERYLSPVIMPNVPFKSRRRRYVKVYFTICYFMMTERI